MVDLQTIKMDERADEGIRLFVRGYETREKLFLVELDPPFSSRAMGTTRRYSNLQMSKRTFAYLVGAAAGQSLIEKKSPQLAAIG